MVDPGMGSGRGATSSSVIDCCSAPLVRLGGHRLASRPLPFAIVEAPRSSAGTDPTEALAVWIMVLYEAEYWRATLLLTCPALGSCLRNGHSASASWDRGCSLRSVFGVQLRPVPRHDNYC